MEKDPTKTPFHVWIFWSAVALLVIVLIVGSELTASEKLVLFTQLISTIATAAAAIAAFLAVKKSHESVLASQKQIKVTQHLELEKLILELDKLFIEKPILWEVYCNSGVSGQNPTAEEEKSIEALIYYYINLFHLAFSFCHDENGNINPGDINSWKPWEAYIKDFFEKCSKSSALLKDENTSSMYRTDFIKYLESKKLLR